MSSSPPVDDRANGAETQPDSVALPGTDDLEALLGTNPAVQRSREKKSQSALASQAVVEPRAVVEPGPQPRQAPPAVAEPALPSQPPAPPKPKRTLGETIWAWLFPVAILLLALLIPVFGLMGYNAILDSSDGDLTAPITDPAAPGFEVIVDPTPVTLLVLVEGETLVGVNVTSLARDDIGGTMMWMPPNTVVEGEDLAAAYAAGGSAAVRDAVAAELTVDVGAVEVIDSDRWAALVEPVAPIVVEVPDALVVRVLDGSTTVQFAPGQLALEPDQVGEYLAWLNPEERQINRLARQQDFFEAWIAQIADSDDPGAVPGEVDTGLGRFIRGVAAGPSITETLPVAPVSGATDDVVEVSDPEAVRVMVTEAIPLPVSPFPGVRPVVKLLDGVGDQPRTLAAIDDLVLGGAQVSVLGNNEAFGVTTTEVRYHVPDAAEPAQLLADALGVGVVKFAPTTTEGETVVIEITVLIGTDYQPDGAAG